MAGKLLAPGFLLPSGTLTLLSKNRAFWETVPANGKKPVIESDSQV